MKDKNVVESLVGRLMAELGIVVTPHNLDTPKRVAKMLLKELFVNLNKDEKELKKSMTTFPNDCSNEAVRIKGIKFFSTCEHHWLPFFGLVDITYEPRDVILGLSKFPRAVEWFSKKPQIQEKLTKEIGEFLVKILDPLYLKVRIYDVRHTCVEARGAEAECTTDTFYEYVGGV